MKNRYDIIVVGGGPAGSWAAKHASEKGASVLLLEKDREIGTPVRCAEGVSELGLRRCVDIQDHWIAQIIKRVRLIAPDETMIEVDSGESGFILHRKLFDYDLAAMAAKAGTDVLTKAYVYDLVIENGFVKGVKVDHLNQIYTISSSIVIGADGVESRVGRWAGMKTHTSPLEMDTCVQMTMTDVDIDSDVAEFYFGRDIAPGGYLWIFPKGERTANVGLGISGIYPKTKKPLAYLQDFVNRKFPNGSILTLVAGGVPTVPTLKEIVRDGLMLVGDAAHQANPLSGGGILNGMIAGKMAGEVAGDAIRTGNVSAKKLSAYPKAWHKAEGKSNERCYQIKKFVVGISDDELNRIAHTLLKIPTEERTILRILKTALIKHPKLILEAIKVFGKGSSR
ncbi:NAD(P)/FAD-dependent oxidoreductase [bacterium]|nr:NAD(P)/FAD-dependent oxidoreductase [bacterium]